MSCYANFLIELCTNKQKLSDNEKISVRENVYAVLQRKRHPKCEDPGTFTIPCTIDDTMFERCILDLKTSINVMPYSIYNSLNLGLTEEIGIIIQLPDRFNAYLKGVVKDVLVQINGLIFLADFYILEMGQLFLKIARTKINIHDGTLIIEFKCRVIHFKIFEAMRYFNDVHYVFTIHDSCGNLR